MAESQFQTRRYNEVLEAFHILSATLPIRDYVDRVGSRAHVNL